MLVLAELKRLTERIDELNETMHRTRADIAVLQFKAGVWGLIAGALPSVAALIYIAIK